MLSHLCPVPAVARSLLGTGILNLPRIAPDPIFNAQKLFADSKNPNKINGTVGIFKGPHILDDIWDNYPTGPIVKHLLNKQKFKDEIGKNTSTYLPIIGDPEYIELMEKCFMPTNIKKTDVLSVQTLSGTGGLYLANSIIKLFTNESILLPEQTWANHHNIFSNYKNYKYLGNELVTYGYGAGKFKVEVEEPKIDVDNMIKTILDPFTSNSKYSKSKYPYINDNPYMNDSIHMNDNIDKSEKIVPVLFHTCAHNPSGIDINIPDWERIFDSLMSVNSNEGKFRYLPIFDTAYAGFASGEISRDIEPLYLAVKKGIPFISIFSCSKNFGLYGARTGLLSLHIPGIGEYDKENLKGTIAKIIRSQYSNPPSFGSTIVKHILQDADLLGNWKYMLSKIVEDNRETRAFIANNVNDMKLNYVKYGKGMFSLLDITPKQIQRLNNKYGIYTVGNRFSYFGIKNKKQLEYFCDSYNKVLLE